MMTNELLSFQNFFVLFQGILVVAITVIVARMKGRPQIFWGILSFFFGIYALFLLVLLPQVKPKVSEKEDVTNREAASRSKISELNQNIVKNDAVLPPTPLVVLPTLEQLSAVDWYFVNDKKEKEGPYRFHKLQEFFNEKKLDEHTFVWSELFTEWKKLGSDEHLLGALLGSRVTQPPT